jgi:hypothetical protein
VLRREPQPQQRELAVHVSGCVAKGHVIIRALQAHIHTGIGNGRAVWPNHRTLQNQGRGLCGSQRTGSSLGSSPARKKHSKEGKYEKWQPRSTHGLSVLRLRDLPEMKW